MQYRELGNSGLTLSTIGLGTMTWGEQNSRKDAFQQLDCALDHGINFVDTAEMYPVPPNAQTQGLTEQYLGDWLTHSGRRQDVVLATKVTGGDGNNSGFDYIRGGPRLNRKQIFQALDDSLRRLQTDYIDLYQVHWPERPANIFGRSAPSDYSLTDYTPIDETWQALNDLVKQGKVRHIGVSNETPWGLMQYQAAADAGHGAPIVSIQNPYNLLNRQFEVSLAEWSINERIGLLAYSPLAFGMLSGKYLQGRRPANGRLTLFERFQRYNHPSAFKATERYVALARQYDISPVHLALGFVHRQPFVASTIIGATTLSQLQENIDSLTTPMSEALLADIDLIHRDISNPAP
ncbi:NADP(H)-dependent aldo-keto reductase [Porticoccus sp.]|uniref:NADP(H)-dependent aldo-keto reductase n=1 Tax=Porticoccus sp. TaxID=2024853 RepID=UPI000C6146B8|nr:NADP(H)-dependent aldo-keto reductase [Porticoccus sp.]MAZ70140.1 NADP(H)-dependent aldo-keto reductase [Porticoccus sp.]|tara:strand:- start:21888 stop:22934 length:1047 start_codon:yes stop_codon:yes gene_type:complete